MIYIYLLAIVSGLTLYRMAENKRKQQLHDSLKRMEYDDEAI